MVGNIEGIQQHYLPRADAFNDWKPDLAITDLSMPKMTGIELCENIRDRSQVPIILLSVRGEDKNKIEALEIAAWNNAIAEYEALLRRKGQNNKGALWTGSSFLRDDHEPRPTTVVLNRVIANVDRESGPIFPFVHPIACIPMDHVMGNIFFESWNLLHGPKLSRRHAHHLFARVAIQGAGSPGAAKKLP